MGGRGRMKEKEDDRRKERNGRLVWQVFYLFRKYRCYDTGWGWSRGKNDNGRKWRAHRSFNPSSAARLLEYIYKLGLEENFQLLTFDFNATIPIYIYIYIDIDDSYNLLYDRIYRRKKKDSKDEDSDSQCPGSMFSVFRLVRVPVKKSGDNRSPQDDPFFFAPGVALAWKKRDRNLSLFLSPSLEQRVKRDLTLSSELNDIANTFTMENRCRCLF